jgi:hypothetical protein
MKDKFFEVTSLAIGIFLMPALSAGAQSGAVIPQGGAGHADQASCIILKRMGPADEVTSHLYSFGIRGKQFQYVEGKFPEGFPFHGRLTDHDVRNLQGRGAEVLMIEPHYTAEDLKGARAECIKMTGKTPDQASDAKASPQEGSTVKTENAPAPPQPAAVQASLVIESTPTSADIEIDGAFVGNTPSTVPVPAGSHKIAIKKKGFTDWEKSLNVSGGTIHLNAELEQAPAK